MKIHFDKVNIFLLFYTDYYRRKSRKIGVSMCDIIIIDTARKLILLPFISFIT